MRRKYLLLLFLSSASPLRASHPTPTDGKVQTHWFFEQKGRRFRHQGSADLLSWRLGGEYEFASGPGLGISLAGQRAQAGGGSQASLGDTSLHLKLPLPDWEREDLTVDSVLGLGLGLPTGDEARGLGSGHPELTPFASLALEKEAFRLHGGISGLFSLDGSEHSEDENLADPHADRELRARLALGFGGKSGYLDAGLAAALPLSGHHKGDLFLTARPELARALGRGWVAALFGELPLSSLRRFEYEAGLQFRKRFGRPEKGPNP